jgi:hypothetical protein
MLRTLGGLLLAIGLIIIVLWAGGNASLYAGVALFMAGGRAL